MYDCIFTENKTKNGNAQKIAALPLFYQFASHENYYKMLYDYNVYDCVTEEYAPQQAVTNTYPTMVDGQVQPSNVIDGGFDTEYLKGTVDKQMAFMNAYNENRDADLEKLAENMEAGKFTLFDDRIDSLTDDVVLDLINNSNQGEYPLRSFVPVRKDTPNVLIEASHQDGLPHVENHPIIMNVEHIQQCMDDEYVAVDGKRGHVLTAEEILDIVKKLDTPRYIFFQQDNGRYNEIVEYDTHIKGKKAMAIVTYAGDRNQSQLNGYKGGKYNILVTTYPPTAEHWKKYISSPNNILVYDATKGLPQRSSGSPVPSLLNGKPSVEDTVPQPKREVKRKYEDGIKKSDRDSTYLDAVLRGDMATVKKMVDAYAIEQGFDTDEDGAPDLLFHGTDSFGFTTVDTAKSDDGATFWATPNMGVAGSYYKGSSYKVRELGREKVTPKGKKLDYYSSMEKAVNAAKPFSAELGQDLSKVKFAVVVTNRKNNKNIEKKVDKMAEHDNEQ